jgi:hypothetical protein
MKKSWRCEPLSFACPAQGRRMKHEGITRMLAQRQKQKSKRQRMKHDDIAGMPAKT